MYINKILYLYYEIKIDKKSKAKFFYLVRLFKTTFFMYLCLHVFVKRCLCPIRLPLRCFFSIISLPHKFEINQLFLLKVKACDHVVSCNFLKCDMKIKFQHQNVEVDTWEDQLKLNVYQKHAHINLDNKRIFIYCITFNCGTLNLVHKLGKSINKIWTSFNFCIIKYRDHFKTSSIFNHNLSKVTTLESKKIIIWVWFLLLNCLYLCKVILVINPKSMSLSPLSLAMQFFCGQMNTCIFLFYKMLKVIYQTRFVPSIATKLKENSKFTLHLFFDNV